MNKTLKPFLFILVAAIIIGAMYLLGGTPPPQPPLPLPPARIDMNQYQSKCNLLGDNQWSPSAYSNLKMELETYTRQSGSGVAQEDIDNLTTYLEQKYAMSMVNTYDEWLIKKGESNIGDVYNAMFKQSNLPGCKAILDTPIFVINRYQQVVGFPNRITQFLSQEYNEAQKSSLENEINTLCNTYQISEFENIFKIKINAQNELDNFKKYYIEVYEYIDAYKRNPANNRLKDFCKNNYINTSKYYFYDEFIKKSGACN